MDRIADWWVDKVEGKAKLGAAMVFAWDSLAMRCPVKIVEALPGERLVFEWTYDGLAGAVVWEIDVAREGGETVVKLVASGFGDGEAWDEMYEGQKGGVPGMMATLKLYLDNHFGERRRVVAVMRETARPDETRRFLTDPDLMTRWLAREAQMGRPGEKARLVLRDSRTWTGPVTKASAGVFEMFCDQVDGCVSLMAWQQRVWVNVVGWKLAAAEAKALEKELGDALDALVALP